MKIKATISKIVKYLLVFICLVAISTSTFSSGNKENKKLSHSKKTNKEQKQEEEKDAGVAQYCAYEAIVPVAHFNIVFYFYFIIRRVEAIIVPVTAIKDSPPLFTMPFYRTLFSLIISPNAP